MRALAVLALLLGSGCAGDETHYHGPGGGGHGGVIDGPDAGPDTTGDAAMPGTLTGDVCVIQTWDAPFACPAIALATDVEVEDIATGGAITQSDTDGTFALDLVNGTDAVIRVGGAGGDLLMSTQSVVSVVDSPVQAPVVEEALMEATLAQLTETQTAGAGVVYVVDPSGPVAGATISFTTGVSVDARLYYDDGAGGFALGTTETDLDGAALLLDIQNVGLRATATDGRTSTATLDTGSLEIGVAVITLPAP